MADRTWGRVGALVTVEPLALAEPWGVASDEGAPLAIDRVEMASGQLVAAGAGVVRVFAVPDALEAELPGWAKATLEDLLPAGFFGGQFGLTRWQKAAVDQAG